MTKGGNLSNMMSHTINISTGDRNNTSKRSYKENIKNKILGLNSKNLNKFNSRDSNNSPVSPGSKVQSRLKKLIGRGKINLDLDSRQNRVVYKGS